jgi:hypothetical protein
VSVISAFARLWADVERGVRDQADVLLHPSASGELGGLVRAADALRQFGATIPPMDLDATWANIALRLAAVGPDRRGVHRWRAKPT